MASRSERKYDSLFASSFDGVLVVYKGRIVAANPATTRLFGYPTEQLLNEPLFMLVHARHANRLLTSRLLPDGMKSPSQNFIIEGVHSSTRTLSLMFATTPIEWDNATALLITIKDVTELQRLETVLGVKSSNGEMIVCFGTDYIVTFANKMFMDVHGPVAIGCDIRVILAPDQMEVFEANTKKLSSENSSVRSHTRHVRDDGTVYFQDWIDNAVFDQCGSPIEYQRIGRTISDALSSAIRDD
jgi:PAS domain S-box-containing protein